MTGSAAAVDGHGGAPSFLPPRRFAFLEGHIVAARIGRLVQSGRGSRSRESHGGSPRQPGTLMTLRMIAEPAERPREEDLQALVQRRLTGRVRDLRIHLCPDGAVLHGRAATYHAKQLAQHAVMELGGVAILANDIEVL